MKKGLVVYQILYEVLAKASNACLIKLFYDNNICICKYSFRSLNTSFNSLNSSFRSGGCSTHANSIH